MVAASLKMAPAVVFPVVSNALDDPLIQVAHHGHVVSRGAELDAGVLHGADGFRVVSGRVAPSVEIHARWRAIWG
jgi:hypothetical protein